jgi:alpha-glucosidase
MAESTDKPWFENAVFYQIYPRSFKDANGDGIGDIKGIIEKLDYLNDGTKESLGIDAIWICPIYASPMKDMGYDISDHTAINPEFGTLEDFDLLIKHAHARGIKVVMDYVINHTSSEHPWFKESRSSINNPKRDWYIWDTPKSDGTPPNNWMSIMGGSAWELDPATNSYYLHHFLKEQPELNWENPGVQKAMLDILEFWIARGVDGFRVDAANFIYEDDFFRDNPPLSANPLPAGEDIIGYDLDIHKMLEAIHMLGEVADKHPGTFFVTESVVRGIKDMVGIYEINPSVVPFNFNFFLLPWDARHYKAFITAYDAALPAPKIPNYVLGNHDQPRIASRLGHQRARLSAFLSLTLRGIPFIYYGEELGMHDVPIPADKIQDGAAAQAQDSTKSRDPARTPMQWSADLNAGFSRVEPWLPLATDFSTYNVDNEKHDPQSFFTLYRTLIHMRRELPALHYGTYEELPSQSTSVFAYKRVYGEEEIVAILNFSGEIVEEALPFERGEILYSTHRAGAAEAISPLQLQPFEGCLLRIKK